jgi:hypothetical protein
VARVPEDLWDKHRGWEEMIIYRVGGALLSEHEKLLLAASVRSY